MLRYRIKVISIMVLVVIVYFAILNYAGVHGTKTTLTIVERDWVFALLLLICVIFFYITEKFYKK